MIYGHIEDRFNHKRSYVFHTMGISATGAAVLLGGAAISAGGAVAGSMISNAGKSSALNAYNSTSKNALKNSKSALSDYQNAMSGINVTAPTVDWISAAGKALGFNQDHIGAFTDMANQMSLSGTNTLLAQQQAADPSFTAKRDQASKNDLAMMNGEVPIDVQQTLSRASAFKGLNTGLGGASGAARNMRARDLGLTSMNLMQQGDQSAQAWTSLINQDFVRPAFVSPFQTMQNNGISSQQGI